MGVRRAFASGQSSLRGLVRLRGAVVVTHGIRWSRFAQPPATSWHPVGMRGGGMGRGTTKDTKDTKAPGFGFRVFRVFRGSQSPQGGCARCCESGRVDGVVSVRSVAGTRRASGWEPWGRGLSHG